jgi:hypothetical protein
VLVCTWLSFASEMQRSIVGSAWEIQSNRPVVGRSRIEVVIGWGGRVPGESQLGH